ncbi:MAG: 50S ribosomal protein L11 methyltransferase [Chloroflexota bacterium]|nr:50S ribosomal protein L11 methyltransferase [Chloroflexota bacterium]
MKSSATWLEFTQQVPKELVEPVSYLFHRYGRGATIEEQPESPLVTLRTYLTSGSTWRRARLEIGVKLIGRVMTVPELQVVEVSERDWEEAWKAHFTLLHIGARLVVKPSWVEYEPAPGEAVVELDPGMAFGTGHHPTTHGCLEALEEAVTPGARLLDLGTGSGILSIAAMRLGASHATALDVDPQACRVARQNVRAAGLSRAVRVVRGSLPHPRVEDGAYQVATTNISALIVSEKAPYLSRALASGGLLIASGFLANQGPSVEAALTEAGFELEGRRDREGWLTLVGRKA